MSAPEQIVRVQRLARPEGAFQIQDEAGSRKQLAYGLKLNGAKQEGDLRAGRPAYFYATWRGDGWVLGKEAPTPDW